MSLRYHRGSGSTGKKHGGSGTKFGIFGSKGFTSAVKFANKVNNYLNPIKHIVSHKSDYHSAYNKVKHYTSNPSASIKKAVTSVSKSINTATNYLHNSGWTAGGGGKSTTHGGGGTPSSVPQFTPSGSGSASLPSTGGNLLDQIQSISDRNSALAQQRAEREMEFNAQEAQKNRDWQQEMSNTAHQREVADLQKAGLNPVLSATGGSGAPVTSGSSASGAHGEVDTSVVPALVNLIGQQTSANSALATAGIAANASLGAAGIHANVAREQLKANSGLGLLNLAVKLFKK